MAQKPLTALVGINRCAARQRIQERIDQAKAVIPNPIQTQDDLSNAEEREKKWYAYNVELLARLFTTDEYADEYRSSKISVHRIADRYDDPSFNTLALRLIESVKRQVARLESIIERLELVDEMAADQPEATAPQDCSKVFVVHGHDGTPKAEVARFIERLGFEAIILHERPNKGRALITKFREEAAGVEFAVVLMTPDDLGKAEKAVDLTPRARQNVVFELGFFIGKLGPERVAALVKGNVEIPSDFDGVVYISLDKDDWQTKLGLELQEADYKIDWNKVMRP